jgi:hypothetical protein
VLLWIAACTSSSISAPTITLGDSFDAYGQLGVAMAHFWSEGKLLQASTYDGSRNMVDLAMGPSFTYGGGYVHDRTTTWRTFGVADGLLPNTSYDVSIAHQVKASTAGSSPQDSRSITGITANGVSRVVQFDGGIDTGLMAWRRLELLATTDNDGNLVVEFGIFQNSGFFTYVSFDDLQIR